MRTLTNIFLFSFVVVVARDAISKSDSRYLRVRVSDPANLECCQTGRQAVETIWVVRRKTNEDLIIVHSSDLVTSHKKTEDGMTCGTLSLKSVQLNDSGLYQCMYFTGRVKHVIEGAYLQVYKPMEKMINLCENTKNKILTAEGILLLLCVLLPATALLCQKRKINRAEKKRMAREEENIYQGLNLDDCHATYDQIERSEAHGPYQDVCNAFEGEEEIQLEKP